VSQCNSLSHHPLLPPTSELGAPAETTSAMHRCQHQPAPPCLLPCSDCSCHHSPSVPPLEFPLPQPMTLVELYTEIRLHAHPSSGGTAPGQHLHSSCPTTIPHRPLQHPLPPARCTRDALAGIFGCELAPAPASVTSRSTSGLHRHHSPPPRHPPRPHSARGETDHAGHLMAALWHLWMQASVTRPGCATIR
jgi:hypothetical protein